MLYLQRRRYTEMGRVKCIHLTSQVKAIKYLDNYRYTTTTVKLLTVVLLLGTGTRLNRAYWFEAGFGIFNLA